MTLDSDESPEVLACSDYQSPGRVRSASKEKTIADQNARIMTDSFVAVEPA